MAVLTRPFFRAQQRLDLEDLDQLLSGLRTDSKLWTRQFVSDKNYILKGFATGGVDGITLTVNIFDSTFILAGRGEDISVSPSVDNESPADLSYYIIEGDAEENSVLSFEITGSLHAASTEESKRLHAYVVLTTENGTPITKAFWDPSANSGSGAEFNQRVNTSVDLAISIDVVETAYDENSESDLARVKIAEIDVNSAGDILSIIDVRPLLFNNQEDFDWDSTRDDELFRVNAGSVASLGINNLSGLPDAGGAFVLGEEVEFLNAGDVQIATGVIDSIEAMDPLLGDVTLGFSSITPDITAITSRKIYIQNVDTTRGTANRIVNELVPNFGRDEKAIGDFKTMFDALKTEIKRLKGTDFWYDDPGASVLDLLRFVNSSVVSKVDNARYIWNGSSLSITESPLDQVAILMQDNSIIDSGTEITVDIGGTRLTVTEGVEWEIGADIERTANSLATAINGLSGFLSTSIVERDFEEWSPTVAYEDDAVVKVTANDGTFQAYRVDTSFPATSTGDDPEDGAPWSPVSFPSPAYIIIIGSDSTTVTQMTENSVGTGLFIGDIRLGNVFVDEGEIFANFDYTNLTDDLVAIKIFGHEPEFILQAETIPVAANHVLFITLPDLDDPTATSTYNDVLQYDDIQPFLSGNTGRIDDYNDLDGANVLSRAAFLDNTVLYKVAPTEEFVHNEKNYWIAFRGETNTLHIRGVGEVGQNEIINIGEGVANQTLSYIGAPDEQTAVPDYESVRGISRFTPALPNAPYTSGPGTDYNDSILTQNQNLTTAISNLNDHVTTNRDIQYQNMNMKLTGGGLWSFAQTGVLTEGTLSIGTPGTVQITIPGLPKDTNFINASDSFDVINFGGISQVIPTWRWLSADQDEVAFVDIDRTGTTTTPHNITIRSTEDFVPTRDRIVIARRSGNDVFVGVNGMTRFSYGDCAPLDGEASLFGLQDGQIPKQLRLTPQGGLFVGITSADIPFTIDKDGDTIDLALPIPNEDGEAKVLQFDGAIIDFAAGRIRDPDDNTMNYLGRADDAPVGVVIDVDLSAIADGEAAYFGISISADSDLGMDATLGRTLGQILVFQGDSATYDPANNSFPEVATFTGSIPIGQILIRNNGGTLETDDGDIIQLGSAGGGGGGGTGDANQDLTEYLDRLNGSIFEFMTPLIGTSINEDLVDSNIANVVPASSTGFKFTGSFDNLTTLDLLDDDFKDLEEDVFKIELLVKWNVAALSRVPRGGGVAIELDHPLIDPNMVWEISKDGGSTYNNFRDAIEKSIQSASTTDMTFTSSNHELSTGHKINFTDIGSLGGGAIDLTTDYYAVVINDDTFALHLTVSGAEEDQFANRVGFTGTAGTAAFETNAGLLDRVGETNVSRGVFNFDSAISDIDDLDLRLRGTLDSGAINGDIATIEISSVCAFYRDEVAETGVEFRALDSVNETLRSSHLHNIYDTNASYGVPGRGITLLDGNGNPIEISVNADGQLVAAGTFGGVAVAEQALGGQVDDEGNVQISF